MQATSCLIAAELLITDMGTKVIKQKIGDLAAWVTDNTNTMNKRPKVDRVSSVLEAFRNMD